MKIMRTFLSVVLVCVLMFAVGCSSTEEADGPRTITVTTRNLDTQNAIHVHFESDWPTEENYIPPGGTITLSVTAQRVGHHSSVYVKDGEDPQGVAPLQTTSVVVTEQSWESRTAEMNWDGNELIFIGW